MNLVLLIPVSPGLFHIASSEFQNADVIKGLSMIVVGRETKSKALKGQ